jgi:adenine-specific DNA-methyltransferase
MNNLIITLNNIIKNNKYFLDDEGNVLIDKVKSSALKMDLRLLEILINNADTKDAFFSKVGPYIVFDKSKFISTLNNYEFLPSSFTSYKKNIGLIDSNQDFLLGRDDVLLSFPYKDALIEFDSHSEDETRDEIFLHEIIAKSEIDSLLSPKVFYNPIKHSLNEKSTIQKYDGENLIIKGNNLIALSSLKQTFESKINFMYWDVLYNTKSDMVPYNDSFKHSSWLTMMKNRLVIAYDLLKQDGSVIALQCDDNEQAYLKVLMDEIFGRENFVNCIAVKMSEATGVKMAHADKKFPKLKEYILVYKKGEIQINYKDILIPINELGVNYKTFVTGLSDNELNTVKRLLEKQNANDEDVELFDSIVSKIKLQPISKIENSWSSMSDEEQTKWKIKNADKLVREVSSNSAKKIADIKRKVSDLPFFGIKTAQGKIYLIKGDYSLSTPNPNIKLIFASNYISVNPCDFWSDIKTTRVDNEGNVELLNGKKPESIVKRLLLAFTKENDLILDAYLGSGTTAATAMKMNRKFIGIEQLDSHFEKSVVRLINVINGDKTGISDEVGWTGGGSFIATEIAKDNQSIVDKIMLSTSTVELINIMEDFIKDPRVLNYRIDINNARTLTLEAFKEFSFNDMKAALVLLLEKNILYKDFYNMEDTDVDSNSKDFTKSLYRKGNLNV